MSEKTVKRRHLDRLRELAAGARRNAADLEARDEVIGGSQLRRIAMEIDLWIESVLYAAQLDAMDSVEFIEEMLKDEPEAVLAGVG